MRTIGWMVALAAAATLGQACSESPAPSPPPSASTPKPAPSVPKPEPEPPQAEPAELTGEALAERGKTVYMSNCIACHNMDPTQAGALGPAVMGSSRELLEARVLRAQYPPGYTPKRDTNAMLALPHLEGEIDALAAYLNRG